MADHKEVFMKLREENRRLALCRFLAEEPDYSLNTSLLEEALDMIGLGDSRDVIHADGAWLANVGVVTVDNIGPVRVLRLTTTGLDVVQGKLRIDGIKRPGPRKQPAAKGCGQNDGAQGHAGLWQKHGHAEGCRGIRRRVAAGGANWRWRNGQGLARRGRGF